VPLRAPRQERQLAALHLREAEEAGQVGHLVRRPVAQRRALVESSDTTDNVRAKIRWTRRARALTLTPRSPHLHEATPRGVYPPRANEEVGPSLAHTLPTQRVLFNRGGSKWMRK
jgi:hypothetical protein